MVSTCFASTREIENEKKNTGNGEKPSERQARKRSLPKRNNKQIHNFHNLNEGGNDSSCMSTLTASPAVQEEGKWEPVDESFGLPSGSTSSVSATTTPTATNQHRPLSIVFKDLPSSSKTAVELNVGGKRFTTRPSTLLRLSRSFVKKNGLPTWHGACSDRSHPEEVDLSLVLERPVDEVGLLGHMMAESILDEGAGVETYHLFVDRDGTVFRHILNFLRDARSVASSDVGLLTDLLAESEYYLLSDLSTLLRSQLKSIEQGQSRARRCHADCAIGRSCSIVDIEDVYNTEIIPVSSSGDILKISTQLAASGITDPLDGVAPSLQPLYKNPLHSSSNTKTAVSPSSVIVLERGTSCPLSLSPPPCQNAASAPLSQEPVEKEGESRSLDSPSYDMATLKDLFDRPLPPQKMLKKVRFFYFYF